MDAWRTALGALGLALAALGSGGPAAATDWAPGEKITFIHCGRCHVIGPRNRMGGIGSTPKFSVIRNWPDWEEKMRGFYALNPHPAFTQVAGVTEPFPQNRPSPIHPIEITLEEIDEVVEFTRKIEPANLGAPIR